MSLKRRKKYCIKADLMTITKPCFCCSSNFKTRDFVKKTNLTLICGYVWNMLFPCLAESGVLISCIKITHDYDFCDIY